MVTVSSSLPALLLATQTVCFLLGNSDGAFFVSQQGDHGLRPFVRIRPSTNPTGLLEHAPEADGTDNSNEADGGESDFYRDLERAKKDKLGADIPKKQLEASAEGPTNEFLEAMREARQEFQEAKDTLGSEAAIAMFMEKIESEDKKRNYDDVIEPDSTSFEEDGAFE